MANKSNRVPAVVAEAEAAFSPAERAYIESGGETDLSAEPTATEAPQATQAPETQAPTATAAPLSSPEPTVSAEPQKMVPHGALHEERERRKEAERREKIAEERFALVLQKINQPAQTPAPTAAPLPDADKDPAGFLSAVLQHVGQRLQAVEGATHQQTQQQTEQAQMAAIGMRVQAMEQEFATATPDYKDALLHLGQQRDEELKLFGITDPAERSAMLRTEAQQIALQALQAGQNPAERVYAIAKHRGYQVKTEPQATQAPAATPAPQLSDADRLKQVAKGQDQSVNLGNASGSSPSPKTAARLLEMTNEQFAKAMEDPEWRSHLGA